MTGSINDIGFCVGLLFVFLGGLTMGWCYARAFIYDQAKCGIVRLFGRDFSIKRID
jgi:hypothetical protein